MKKNRLTPKEQIKNRFFNLGIFAWIINLLHSIITESSQINQEFLLWGTANIIFLILYYSEHLFSRKIPYKGLIFILALESSLILFASFLMQSSITQIGLLLLVVTQMAYLLPWRFAFVWILSHGVLITLIRLLQEGIRQEGIMDALALSTGHFCFQLMAFRHTRNALSETEARLELARVNEELVKSRELLQKATQKAERLHISRELHDVAGHSLMALDMHLDIGLHHLSDEKYHKSKEHFQYAKELGKRLSQDVRKTVKGLRTSLQNDLPYEIHHLTEQTKLNVHLKMDQDFQVSCPTRSHIILRSLQEILVNTTLHAQASQIWISLAYQGKNIVLQAKDDGQGMQDIQEGSGLTGMRERVEEVGGNISIYTAPNQGMNIKIQLPMSEAI